MTTDYETASILARIQAAAIGLVPDHWRVKKVGQLIDEGIIEKIQDGNHGESHPVESDYVPSGTPFIMSGAIREGRVDLQQCKYITSEHAKSLRVGHARKGDVLLTHKGNQLGRVAILENAEWAILTPQVTYYRVIKQDLLDARFLKFYFQSPRFQHQFTRDAEQSTRPFVSLSAQRHLFIAIPPIAEQRAISDVLQVLEEKAESNQQMNLTLEAMARAIFQSWFVEFDPVHAKVDGRAPAGMDAATAALFPEHFEDSELGKIPAGWKVSSVYDIAEVVYGAPFASQNFNGKGVGKPLIRIRDLACEKSRVWTTEVHPKGYIVQPGDILVGMDGEFRAYLWGGLQGWLNQRICVFLPKPGYSTAFVRYSIAGPLAEVEATETATTVIHLGKNDIDRFKVIIPARPILEAFSRFSRPLDEKIVATKQESRTLATLRDTLLPKLISGELRVPEADSMSEAVS